MSASRHFSLLFTLILGILLLPVTPSQAQVPERTASVSCVIKKNERLKLKPPPNCISVDATVTERGSEATVCSRARAKAFRKVPRRGCLRSNKWCTCTVTAAGESKASAKLYTEAERRASAKRYKERFGKKTKSLGDLTDLNDKYAPDWGEKKKVYDEKWEKKQGFPGVYDPTNGKLIIRPSPPQGKAEGLSDFTIKKMEEKYLFDPDKKETNAEQHYWVYRNQGHGQLAKRLDPKYEDRFKSLFKKAKKLEKDNDVPAFKKLGDPNNRTKLLRAFTLIRAQKKKNDKWVFTIHWKSQTINIEHCQSLVGEGNDPLNHPACKNDYLLPEKLRQDVLDAIAHHAPEVFENLEAK